MQRDEFRLTYPLFAINLGNGYHALEGAPEGGSPQFAMAVFTSEKLAADYMK